MAANLNRDSFFRLALRSKSNRSIASFYDVITFLPKELSFFETELKKLSAAVIARGQVTIKLWVSFSTPVLMATPNLPLARQLKAAWEAIAADLKLPQEQGFILELLKGERVLFPSMKISKRKRRIGKRSKKFWKRLCCGFLK